MRSQLNLQMILKIHWKTDLQMDWQLENKNMRCGRLLEDIQRYANTSFGSEWESPWCTDERFHSG